jgi:hypothetical protein
MSRPRHDPTADTRAADIFALLTDDDKSAAVAVFVELLRFSPALRNWLWTEFAQSATTRERLAEWLKTGGPPPANGLKLLATLASEQRGFERERLRLKETLPVRIAARPYGGLARSTVEQIIRSYQASGTDLGAYLLAASWKRAKTPESDPRLLRAGRRFLAEACGNSRPELVKRLAHAVRLVGDRPEAASSKTAYGFTNWWKLCILLYVLNHPKPRYRIRELCAHLASQHLPVGATNVRAFCRKHGVARDRRAGRPGRSQRA